MRVVHVMPGRLLQARVHRLVAGDQVHVDRLHALAGNEAHGRVARGGHEVEATLVHQRHHLVGGAGGLHVDLAAGLLLEVGHPVEVLVGLAAFDVAGPGHDVDLAFALAQLLQGRLRLRGGHQDGQ
ncbi:hypothetical protein D9M68_913300 [compost metagenome]